MATPLRISAVPRQRGMALVLVLSLLSMVLLLTSALNRATRADIASTTLAVHRSQARAWAEAGIWWAIWDSARPADVQQLSGVTASHSLTLDEQVIDISVEDETGKVHLNQASDTVLMALLRSATNDPHAAAALTDRVLDWRDADDKPRPLGAEKGAPLHDQVNYAPRDAPFLSVSELRRVAGMTDATFRRIAPHLTVYGRHASVNRSAAPPALLEALSTGEGPQEAGRSSLHDNGVTTRGRRGRSAFYTIQSSATVGLSTVTLRVTVQQGSGRRRGYSVLSWREVP